MHFVVVRACTGLPVATKVAKLIFVSEININIFKYMQ